MNAFTALMLGLSTLTFFAAGNAAKWWTDAPGWPKLVLTLGLYTLGNLIMLRLIREVGMAAAFSLSAVLQLVAINAVALFYWGETLAPVQMVGVVLAIASVALITLGPSLVR